MKRTLFFTTALVAAIIPSICIASHISIATDAASTFSNGNIFLNVTLTNKGDEQARALQVKAPFGSNCIQSEILESLETNTTARFTLALGNAPERPGIYRIPIKVHYEDLNGYPSTAISTVPLITGDIENPGEDLITKLTPARISTSGEIELQLSGKTKETVNASITLVFPDEISFDPPDSSVIILPGSTCAIRLKIHNISALEGSSYPVTAIIDYQDKSFHRSATACAQITITGPFSSVYYEEIAAISAIALFILFIAMQFLKRKVSTGKTVKPNPTEFTPEQMLDSICAVLVLTVILGFTLVHIPPKYLLMDTTTTGGDTIAHNYLASHLKDQLFNHGRVVSWAGGWWCGFPMFQYYFCLPYLLMALLSVLIPFNIAFKLISVIGIFALPSCAYLAGRLMKLPKPVPVLLAIASLPFLFTHAHTMWGANIYSTFAGMIANSLSFPLMLLFIASSWRDADTGQFRPGTAILLALVIASHFFTSVIGLLCVAIIPLLKPGGGRRKAILVIAGEFALAFLLMAWWIIPLLAKDQYSLDFGTNWNISLLDTIPKHMLIPTALLAMTTLILGIIRQFTAIILLGWMLAVSIFLFYFGFAHVAQVFVNVRLWPFAYFAVLALCAAGLGMLIAGLRHKYLAVITILIATLTYGIDKPNNVRAWAKWNYEGAEKKPRRQAFQKLTEPLKETPGRLANDLHENNNLFGSSRVFESVPHLAGKPILEGGIVNSAACSMFSYYIQGETSRNCAGFPNLVSPPPFNFENATKHLKLFNVKHFIARGTETKNALSKSRDWRLLVESDGWQLYELLTNDGNYVCALQNMPVGIRFESKDKDNWKKAGLEWIYCIQLIDQTFVFLLNGEPADKRLSVIISEKNFLKHSRSVREGSETVPASTPLNTGNVKISEEEISDNKIKFRTTGIGMPHLIKCSYFPNWKVKGAKHIYMATPCFMLVYPEQEQVELYYGYTASDKTGIILSILGLLTLGLLSLRAISRKKGFS